MKSARWFDFLGTHDGGMHITMQGKDHQSNAIEKTWYIIAKNSDGPMIPTVPAVLMAHKILNNEFRLTGVHPCIGMLSLKEYCQGFEDFDIETYKL